MKKLLVKATRDVEFSFNNTMFQQTDGVAMGSPLGPVLANIFLGFHESRIPESQWPRLYRRFVDDTFSLVESRDSAVKFLHCLNDLHPGVLKYTMKGEEERRLPFMDVLVRREQNRFTTSVYRKPTFTGLYTRWDSYCPTCRKIALIRSLLLNATRKEDLFAAVPERRDGELAGDLSEERLSRANRQSQYEANPEPPS